MMKCVTAVEPAVSLLGNRDAVIQAVGGRQAVCTAPLSNMLANTAPQFWPTLAITELILGNNGQPPSFLFINLLSNPKFGLREK